MGKKGLLITHVRPKEGRESMLDTDPWSPCGFVFDFEKDRALSCAGCQRKPFQIAEGKATWSRNTQGVIGTRGLFPHV